MDKQEKIEEIDRKCRMAGCNEAAAKRHLQFFVYERWDVHPPADFTAWFEDHGEGNSVTAWNCQSVRDEFLEAKEFGIVQAS